MAKDILFDPTLDQDTTAMHDAKGDILETAFGLIYILLNNQDNLPPGDYIYADYVCCACAKNKRP